MRKILLGFILGIVFCTLTGAAIYRPVRSIIIRTESSAPTTIDLKAIMLNQETIYNLIKNTCGEN